MRGRSFQVSWLYYAMNQQVFLPCQGGEGAVLKTVLNKSLALLVAAWRDHATFKSRDLERVV